MIIIIDLSYIMYNDLWMWNKTKLNYKVITAKLSPACCYLFPLKS
jgi:hypothetical protein